LCLSQAWAILKVLYIHKGYPLSANGAIMSA
jgi:hypothetical protein